ncbi:MAG: hypothetical protein AAFU54_05845 [Chloroflexota bacterium]
MAEISISGAKPVQNESFLDWAVLLRFGLIAGIVVVYTSAVGMVETFNEREVIRDWVTLGQMLLFVPAIIAGFFGSRRLRESGNSSVQTLLSSVLIGAISAVPVLILLLIAVSITDVRDMFVNVNRDLVEILTFNNDSRFVGALLFVGFTTIAGLFGGVLDVLPQKIRKSLLTGLGITLGVGVMAELVSLILEQLLDRDAYSEAFRDSAEVFTEFFFRRDILKVGGAATLLIVSFALTMLWSYNANTIRTRYAALPKTQKTTFRSSGFTLLGILLLILPWVLGTFLSEVMNNIGLYVLMGLGLNIAIGLAGLLDLGYVTNFAVGAYVMGVLTSTGPLGLEQRLGIAPNFWLVLPISLLSAMLTGFLFALPVLKMRGDYLAIATLGFGEIIGKLALSDWFRPVIGGAQGVLQIPAPSIFGYELNDPQTVYYIVLAACALALFVSTRLNNSRTGRQWMSIREDEDVAAAMGIDTAQSKLLAFTLSAATGGLAGAIFAARLGTIFPNSFNVIVSINVLSLIIVGGMGSIPGVVIGAVVLIGLPELLREFSEYRFLLYGALLVYMMVSRPEGLVPSTLHRREMQDGQRGEQIHDPQLNPSPADDEATVR